MDSVCFSFPCESKGHKGVFAGHILPSSAQESDCINLTLSRYSRDGKLSGLKENTEHSEQHY